MNALQYLALTQMAPKRTRALRRSLKFLVWILQKNGYDAYAPDSALQKARMEIHIAARSPDEAERISKRLMAIYGLELKKKLADGTNLLEMPHLIAVVVGRRPGFLGAAPGKITLTVADLRKFRDEVLANIRKHCAELYKRGMSLETCRAAAVIAAAEISDVLKERFGIRI